MGVARLRPASLVVLIATVLPLEASAQGLPGASTQPESYLAELPGAERAREAGRESPFAEAIETDRDSFTPTTTTPGRGGLIFESAYTFFDQRGIKEGHSFPEAIFRLGLTERLEWRLGWNREIGGVEPSAEDPARGRLERESNLSYGFKYRLNEQSCWLPSSAFIVQASTPTSGKENNTLFVGTYVVGWELPRRWKLDAALRYASDKEARDHFQAWAPSIVLKVPLSERVLAHAEYFGIFSSGKADEFTRHYFSPGVHYLVTPDLEVGVRVGWGLNDQASRFFCNAGVGWRF